MERKTQLTMIAVRITRSNLSASEACTNRTGGAKSARVGVVLAGRGWAIVSGTARWLAAQRLLTHPTSATTTTTWCSAWTGSGSPARVCSAPGTAASLTTVRYLRYLRYLRYIRYIRHIRYIRYKGRPPHSPLVHFAGGGLVPPREVALLRRSGKHGRASPAGVRREIDAR